MSIKNQTIQEAIKSKETNINLFKVAGSGICKQINSLAENNPDKKVALISLNSFLKNFHGDYTNLYLISPSDEKIEDLEIIYDYVILDFESINFIESAEERHKIIKFIENFREKNKNSIKINLIPKIF